MFLACGPCPCSGLLTENDGASVQLTSFTDYALRVLIFLGVTDDRLVTIEEISSSYGISRHHLTKVVHRLGALGYVETVRGKNGGNRLAREAAKIRLGDVVRDFEDNLVIVECFDRGASTCPIEPGCGLKGILRSATGKFFEELDRYTLADLLRSPKRLRPLLESAPRVRAPRGA